MLSSQELFNPISDQIYKYIRQNQPILLKNQFISNNTSIYCILTSSFILLQQQSSQNIYYCQLNFDIKFQVLRKQWQNLKTPGQPIGIILEKQNISSKISLFNNDSSILNNWIKLFQKKINQRNFHQLFKAKKKIGKGAFAAVYLTQRLIDGKLFAVKAFSKQKQFSSQKGKQSLQNEIKIMRNLNNENVMKLQCVYETQNSIYIILQYLQGLQLYDQIKNKRQFKQQQIKTIIKSLLNGLNHLSQNKVIHRDIKPQNILFRSSDSLQTVICDFGLATFSHQQKYLFVRCGTPGFVAPQIINIKDMNSKSYSISDVFSAGLIFHYLLMNKSIFTGKHYQEILNQNRMCEFDFSQKEYHKLTYEAKDLLMKMLQKNPQKRISAKQALRHQFFNMNMDIQQQPQINKPESIINQFYEQNIMNKSIFIEKNNQILPTPSTFTGNSNKKVPKILNRLKKKDSINMNSNISNINSNKSQLLSQITVKQKTSIYKQNSSHLNNFNKTNMSRSRSRANKVMIDEKEQK